MIILTAIIIAVASFGKYADGRIHDSATTILEDRLKCVPLLSHRFDYYGTSIKDGLISYSTNIDTLLSRKSEILQTRAKTQKMWDSYKNTYLAPDEDSMVKLTEKLMIKMDKDLDIVFDSASINKEVALKMIDSLRLKEQLGPIMDNVNDLTDLQTRVGAEETIKMLSLLSIFDNFMIAALALAFMLIGSIIYSAIRDKKEQSKILVKKTPVKRAIRDKKEQIKIPVKKTPVKRAIVKKTSTTPRKPRTAKPVKNN